MKKILLFFAVILWIGLNNVDAKVELKTWRSSETSTADSHVLIATGAIILWEIQVTSGNPGLHQFRYFNSTSTDAGVDQSTSTFYDVDTTRDYWEIKDYLTDGLVYTKTGNSAIRILWDWYIAIPKGQESRGLK